MEEQEKDMTKPQEPSMPGNTPPKAHETTEEEEKNGNR